MNNAELIGQIRSLLDRLERGETSAEAAGDELKEVLPAWHPKPTCAGLWVVRWQRHGTSSMPFTQDEIDSHAYDYMFRRAYGPIPEPPK